MPSSNVAYCIPRNILDSLAQDTAGLKKWGGGGLPVGGAGGGGGWGSWFSWNAAGLWRGGGGVGAFQPGPAALLLLHHCCIPPRGPHQIYTAVNSKHPHPTLCKFIKLFFQFFYTKQGGFCCLLVQFSNVQNAKLHNITLELDTEGERIIFRM